MVGNVRQFARRVARSVLKLEDKLLGIPQPLQGGHVDGHDQGVNIAARHTPTGKELLRVE
jgi:hypothetical protein